MIIKIKSITAEILLPLATPDGSSLEEKVNVFLNTLDPKDVRNVETYVTQGGRFGMNMSYNAIITYTV